MKKYKQFILEYTSQQRLDHVLDKISKSGIESLNQKEKKFLDSFSKGEEDIQNKKIALEHGEDPLVSTNDLFKFYLQEVEEYEDEMIVYGDLYYQGDQFYGKVVFTPIDPSSYKDTADMIRKKEVYSRHDITVRVEKDGEEATYFIDKEDGKYKIARTTISDLPFKFETDNWEELLKSEFDKYEVLYNKLDATYYLNYFMFTPVGQPGGIESSDEGYFNKELMENGHGMYFKDFIQDIKKEFID